MAKTSSLSIAYNSNSKSAWISAGPMLDVIYLNGLLMGLLFLSFQM